MCSTTEFKMEVEENEDSNELKAGFFSWCCWHETIPFFVMGAVLCNILRSTLASPSTRWLCYITSGDNRNVSRHCHVSWGKNCFQLRITELLILIERKWKNQFIDDPLLSRFSRVWLCATPWTAAHQTPPSLGLSRQEHWSGLPFPSPTHESEKWNWSPSVVSDS